MKKIICSLFVIAGTLCLSSCGFTNTNFHANTETKVVLSESNFKVVGQAYGEAKATYVLGLGGIRTKALRNNAINEMSKNAKLNGSQTLVNVTTHESVKMITPLYMVRTVTATANIVEFK